MKLIVFGAATHIGRHLVENAILDGQTVTAFYRPPDRVRLQSPRLRTFSGDVLHYPAVERACAGQQAAFIALGKWGHFHHSTLLSEGTQTIIRALQAHGVWRVVAVLSGGAYAETPERPHSPMQAEHLRQLIALKHSGLNWTAIYPPAELSYLPVAEQTNRLDDLALFTLDELYSPAHLHQAIPFSVP
ncbi:MAG: NAD(P)-dependent oxidoreductase [Anaerolineales bacterium]